MVLGSFNRLLVLVAISHDLRHHADQAFLDLVASSGDLLVFHYIRGVLDPIEDVVHFLIVFLRQLLGQWDQTYCLSILSIAFSVDEGLV